MMGLSSRAVCLLAAVVGVVVQTSRPDTGSKAADSLCEVLDNEQESPCGGLPPEMIKAIAMHLTAKDYVQFARALPDTMRFPELEMEHLRNAARELTGYTWYDASHRQPMQALMVTVADLYGARARLSPTFSAHTPPTVLQDAAARIVFYYDECIDMAFLCKGNANLWKRNCNELFFSKTFSSATWPLLPDQFRERYREVALNETAERGNRAAFGFLLEHEVYDLGAIAVALFSLAEHGHFELFRDLLQKRFYLASGDHGKIEDILGEAFWATCSRGRMDFFEELVRIDDASNTLFYGSFGAKALARGLEAAVNWAQGHLVQRLLSLRGNPIYEPVDAVKHAIATGDSQAVAAVLKREEGIPLYPELDVSDDEVKMAAERGHAEVLQLLLESLPEDRLYRYLDGESEVGRAVVQLIGWGALLAYLIPVPEA